MAKDRLRVSEMFYSIQGEGSFCGQPSVFLRLQGCNLTCGGKSTITSKHCEGKATWRCDTIEVWTKGNSMSFQKICEEWERNKWIDRLTNGAHLVITGGEPLLQMDVLGLFLDYYNQQYQTVPFIEIETNGTIEPSSAIKKYIKQYNVALKLTNSGLQKENYFVKKAIQFFTNQKYAFFKFVVSNEQDIKELEETYIEPFQLDQSKIMLMPAADNKHDLAILEPNVIEWCKQRAWRYSARLHINIWDKKTGV
tara:strand:- start:2264 stop:3019 length:756 start_codon:yes stop_codon:yes gene_type:complete